MPQKPGIPVNHVAQYFGLAMTTQLLNCGAPPQSMEVLKEPTEIKVGPAERERAFIGRSPRRATDYDVFVGAGKSYVQTGTRA